mgnify:FL=1
MQVNMARKNDNRISTMKNNFLGDPRYFGLHIIPEVNILTDLDESSLLNKECSKTDNT